jgi:hypothetical protein
MYALPSSIACVVPGSNWKRQGAWVVLVYVADPAGSLNEIVPVALRAGAA